MLMHKDAISSIEDARNFTKTFISDIKSESFQIDLERTSRAVQLWVMIDELRVLNEKEDGPVDDARLEAVEELISLARRGSEPQPWMLVAVETILDAESLRLGKAYVHSIP